MAVRKGLVLFLALLLVGTVQGQSSNRIEDATYPTVTALRRADIPVRSRTDLARRLRGVDQIAPPPTNPPALAVGALRSFWVTNSDANEQLQVASQLLAVGDHIYIWAELGLDIPPSEAEGLAASFDANIYDQVRALWGSEALPGVDGDPRVHVLFSRHLGFSVAGYFASDHTSPVEVLDTSNEAEMFFISYNATGPFINDLYAENILAHEFQHMIRANVDENEDSWLDEGFSTFTELYTGYEFGSASFTLTFLNSPDDQLNEWTESGDRAVDYGGAMLFVTYFYERYGLEGLQLWSADPDNGLIALDNTLRALGEPSADEFFADWVLANILLDSDLEDGRYGYTMLTGLIPARSRRIDLPETVEDQRLNQYATDYYRLVDLDDAEALKVSITMPPTVPLIPVSATSGKRMWYSNRGDQSDMTLTREFDLSDVDHATLEYNVWYHTESLWDYGYVMASRDGQQWDILETREMSTSNPHNTAYGPGYTGESGGWISESISLDAYAGGRVYLRFEMITDDAVNQPGMAIDDVRIPEIGYSSNFEADDGGWQPAGWIYMDNLLPQRAWVQAVQFVDDEVIITRWLAEGNATWTLELAPDVDKVIFAVSPFAPVTTVPTTYTLTVERN